MGFKKILWPSDASQPSLLALQKAIELAEVFGADLFALQVISRVPMLSQTGFASPGPDAFDVPLYEQQLLQEVEKSLAKTVADLVPEEIAAESSVEYGEPDEVIVDMVRRKNIDLIVMATHGRMGFARLLLGSIAEKVIRSSPVPVLTIPPAGQ